MDQFTDLKTQNDLENRPHHFRDPSLMNQAHQRDYLFHNGEFKKKIFHHLSFALK